MFYTSLTVTPEAQAAYLAKNPKNSKVAASASAGPSSKSTTGAKPRVSNGKRNADEMSGSKQEGSSTGPAVKKAKV